MLPDPDLPRSSRGRATRERLLTSAREAFETHGFVDTRVSHIARAAGVAYGSFYTHFDNKESIFYEVADRLFETMFEERPLSEGATPSERLAAANQSYWERYRAHAPMMAIIEQVSTIDPTFRTRRQAHRRVTTDRMAASIRRWQERGVVHADLDPHTTAQSLTVMVDRVLYLRHVLGEDSSDEETSLATVNLLTVRALGLAP